MYAIYTTPGFIIGSKPYSEAGKILFIFTRDFGLITAIAQGIRLEKSKLRYSAQDYKFGIFSLVKGKEFWRLISVGESISGHSTVARQSDKQLVARLALLLRRFIHGESEHSILFSCIESGIQFLERTGDLSEEQLKTLESVIVFRMLELLGYIGKDQSLQNKFNSNEFSIEMLDDMTRNRVTINQHINKALRESHL